MLRRKRGKGPRWACSPASLHARMDRHAGVLLRRLAGADPPAGPGHVRAVPSLQEARKLV
jgi:hypothetical protein